MEEEIDYIYSPVVGDERECLVGWYCPKCEESVDTWGWDDFEASRKLIVVWDDDVEDEDGEPLSDHQTGSKFIGNNEVR